MARFTLPRDLCDKEEIQEIVLSLVEQVTYRLRRYNLLANTVNVQLRTKDFEDKLYRMFGNLFYAKKMGNSCEFHYFCVVEQLRQY